MERRSCISAKGALVCSSMKPVRFLTAHCQIFSYLGLHSVWTQMCQVAKPAQWCCWKPSRLSSLKPLINKPWKHWERAWMGNDMRRTKQSNGRQRVLLITCYSDFWSHFSSMSYVAKYSSKPGVCVLACGHVKYWNWHYVIAATGLPFRIVLLQLGECCWSWVVHHKS